MKLFQNIFNFYLYSGIHIAIGAVALSLQSSIWFQVHLPIEFYVFVFSSTILVYSLHKIISAIASEVLEMSLRFLVISQFRKPIFIAVTFSGILSLWSFTHFTPKLQLSLIAPTVISLLYIFPLFRINQRLRDIDFIKIFLIALVWSIVTVSIPYSMKPTVQSSELFTFSLERFIYIFAITLPFDIRDYSLDKKFGVQTFAHILGSKKTKYLSLIFLAFCQTILIIGLMLFHLNLGFFIAQTVVYALTGTIIHYTSSDKHDYFFSGIIDGLLILGPALNCLAFLLMD